MQRTYDLDSCNHIFANQVFLGLGLPWMIGAFYWSSEGRTKEWEVRIQQKKPALLTNPDLKDGGFVVVAGTFKLPTGICFSFSFCESMDPTVDRELYKRYIRTIARLLCFQRSASLICSCSPERIYLNKYPHNLPPTQQQDPWATR